MCGNVFVNARRAGRDQRRVSPFVAVARVARDVTTGPFLVRADWPATERTKHRRAEGTPSATALGRSLWELA